MKPIKTPILLLMLLMAIALHAQQPLSYKDFYKKDTVTVTEGYFNAYTDKDHRYYVELPKASLDKNVLVTVQAVLGQSAYVSPTSGVVKFTMGRENTVNMYRSMLTEGVADTTDICMMNSIRKSGLLPVAQVFPIVAYGKDGKSPIIEVTQDLNGTMGLFATADLSTYNNPDPSRSGVRGVRAIDGGVVFQVQRTQNSYFNDPNSRHGEDIVNTCMLEMLLQRLPDAPMRRKDAHKAYGFLTKSIYEYDTKRYIATEHDYVVRWRKDAIPITVYIDPVTPAPFQESIKNAVAAWQKPLEQAGWKNPFRISSDPKDATLSYKKILFRWGIAYNGLYHDLITDSVHGEILGARVNVMDVPANDLLYRYFLQCGDKDPRILKDAQSVAVRKEILQVLVEQQLAEVLGMKHNYAASTARLTANLRSNTFLAQHGMSPSITSQLTFNYVAGADDHVGVRNLLPQISSYDYEAMAYLYGNSKKAPSDKLTFHAAQDKLDPYAQDYIARDVVEASTLGILHLGKMYPKIDALVKRLPNDQDTWHLVNRLGVTAVDLYSAYTFQVSGIIGGRSRRAVIPGVNEKGTTYVDKATQLEALRFLQKNLYASYPAWFENETMRKAVSTNMADAFANNARFTFERMLKAETLNALVEAEKANGAQAFTCQDLFGFLTREVLKDFNPSRALGEYERAVASMLIGAVLDSAGKTNFLMGMNDAASLTHAYLMDVTAGAKKMAKECKDEPTRRFYEMTIIKLNHEYFNK